MENYIYYIDSSCSLEIERKTFNLVGAYPEKEEDGSYSVDTYEQANANGLIIVNEIKKAYQGGYKKVVFEKGNYFVCAKWTNYYELPYSIPIEEVYDLEIDFNNSNIKLIYDSDRYNQYCTMTSYATYLQRGYIIGFRKCSNIVIENLNLIGDAIDRSWTQENEKQMEQTYGLSVGSLCSNFKIRNVTGRYFMGDVFTGMESKYYHLVNFNIWNVDKGVNESSGELIDVEPIGDIHSLTSKLFDFDDTSYSSGKSFRQCVKEDSIKGYENFFQFSPYAGTYTYQKSIYTWKAALYKRQEPTSNYILSKIINCELQQIVDMSQYDAIRLIIDNSHIDFEEADTSLGTWEHNFYTDIYQVKTFNVVVENCYIADCHRGGISNMPNNFVVSRTIFQNCGMDCGIGAPLFPNSTRYCYNQEEQYIDKVTIDQCEFLNSYNANLISAQSIYIRNSNYINCNSGIIVNVTVNALIDNCFLSNSGVGGAIFNNTPGWRGGDYMKSIVKFNNCTIYASELGIYDIVRRSIIFDHCQLYLAHVQINNNEDLKFVNTNIYLMGQFTFYSDNRFWDVYLENTVIESIDDSNRALNVNNVKGKNIEIKNTRIYYLSSKSSGYKKVLLEGLIMDENSKLLTSNSETDIPLDLELKNCIFDNAITILPQTDMNTTCLIENCRFNKKENPIKIDTYINSSGARQVNCLILNSIFYGAKDNAIEGSLMGDSQDIDIIFGNCKFLNIQN